MKNGFLQHLKENKTVNSLFNALFSALALWLVFAISFFLAQHFEISENAKIFMSKEAFMVLTTGSLLLLMIFIIYCIYRKKPPYFTFHNDNFAYFTITARFATNYKKAVLPKGEPKKWNFKEDIKTELLDDLFGNIIPNSVIHENKDEWQKNFNKELVKEFIREMDDNITGSSERFYARAPFILVEHYFYFSILNKLNVHEDPYKKTKDRSIKNHIDKINILLCFYKKSLDREVKLKQSICHCVNSNSTDLSQIVGHTSYISTREQNYVNNDLEKIAKAIYNKKFDKVDIITDNYGLELISDIIFALVLLDSDMAQKVVFHVRILPAFVSDVIVSEYGDDFERILDSLTNLAKLDNLTECEVVEKFRKYKTEDKIEIKPNLYWNMHFCYTKTKQSFEEVIPNDKKTLIVVKGDLNFRRLLDDRDWLNKKSFRSRVKSLNASIVALRAIKSSLLVDIYDKKKVCDIRDNITGIDGQYGSIHFYEHKSWRDKLRNMGWASQKSRGF